jgi:seryl-tRNA synthetase
MLDLKLVRSNSDKIKNGLKDRGGRYLPVFEEILKKDAVYRNLQSATETLRSKRNEISKKIQELKASKKDEECPALIIEGNKIKVYFLKILVGSHFLDKE